MQGWVSKNIKELHSVEWIENVDLGIQEFYEKRISQSNLIVCLVNQSPPWNHIWEEWDYVPA